MRRQSSACCLLPGWWWQGAAGAVAGTAERPALQLQSNCCGCSSFCGCSGSCHLFERRSGMTCCTHWPDDCAAAAASVCGLTECHFRGCNAEAVSIVVTRLGCMAAALLLPKSCIVCSWPLHACTLLHPGCGRGGGGGGGAAGCDAARLPPSPAAPPEMASSQLPAVEVLQRIERATNWPRHRKSVVRSATRLANGPQTSQGKSTNRQTSPGVKRARAGCRPLVSRQELVHHADMARSQQGLLGQREQETGCPCCPLEAEHASDANCPAGATVA